MVATCAVWRAPQGLLTPSATTARHPQEGRCPSCHQVTGSLPADWPLWGPREGRAEVLTPQMGDKPART